jgi:RNA polymerase sigma-70 factor (ECF subfamily)
MRDQASAGAYLLACRAAASRSAAVALTGLPWSDREDLEQEARIAVWKAFRDHYSPLRGKPGTFAAKVAANRIASLLRAPHRRLKGVPVEAHHLAGLDGIPAEELRMDVQTIAASLPEADRRLAAYLTDHSPTEASRAFGMARSTVYERIRRIRQAFEAHGLMPTVRGKKLLEPRNGSSIRTSDRPISSGSPSMAAQCTSTTSSGSRRTIATRLQSATH